MGAQVGMVVGGAYLSKPAGVEGGPGSVGNGVAVSSARDSGERWPDSSSVDVLWRLWRRAETASLVRR